MPIRKRSEDEDGHPYVWLEEPAIYVDTYAVQLFASDGIVRFVFGESLPKKFEPLWRVGLVMPIEDTRRLAKRLNAILEKYDNPIEEELEKEPLDTQTNSAE